MIRIDVEYVDRVSFRLDLICSDPSSGAIPSIHAMRVGCQMTTVFVATSGGHLSQLVELADRMSGVETEALWVTFATPQSRSLLNGRRTKFIRAIRERDVVGVCLGAFSAHQIFRSERVSAVVSTGSAIALSYLPYATLRGIGAHYIESAARVGSPSLTGRILERVPRVNLYRQYPHASKGSWRYAGSVFDGFQCSSAGGRDVKRVVVTFGSGKHTFRRLLERLATILPRDIDVLWQTGSTPVDGFSIDAQPMVPASTLNEAIRRADAVIGHAGCGAALGAFNAGKCPLLVPREPQYGELVDSHQVELALWLDKQGLAIHRTPETISLSDVFEAASRVVERRLNPPTFRLG
jgi:UDP-N-acetylglucosamine--N-acetylmuramyl-(pentapeptide) pyrophosphoryl-undecaprenol N-acetylglucosamine transferase